MIGTRRLRTALVGGRVIGGAAGRPGPGSGRILSDVISGVGGKQAIVEDPSGNPVELFEPLRPEARLA